MTSGIFVGSIASMQRKKPKLEKFNTRLPVELLEQLRAYVEEGGLKMQTVMAEAVRKYLKEQKA